MGEVSGQFRAWERRPLWQRRLAIMLNFHAPVLLVLGFALLVPLLFVALSGGAQIEYAAFLLPALFALLLGYLLHRLPMPQMWATSQTEALLVTTAVWLSASLIAAIPFILLQPIPFIDALFEAVSGLTTAGTTMFTQVEQLPRSLLFWRALTQWLGGVGILLLILVVGQSGGNQAFSLLSAESGKVQSGRLSHNFRLAATRFVQIYCILTLSQIVITTLLGMPLFDSIAHALTTASTGGFSTHDESIGYYRNHAELFPNYIGIELSIIFFMLAGGSNFYILYRLSRADWRALGDGVEMRILWLLLAAATIVVGLSRWFEGGVAFWESASTAFFGIAALMSTTGFETIPTGLFGPLARQIFLFLMLWGGCAGSTAGGIKLIRLAVVKEFLRHEIRRLRLPLHAVDVPVIDGAAIPQSSLRQAMFIILLWFAYLGGASLLIGWQLPALDAIDAYSITFSALGGYGPSFVPVAVVAGLPSASKWVLMVGMLAGRLEILPLLVFLNPYAWRR